MAFIDLNGALANLSDEKRGIGQATFWVTSWEMKSSIFPKDARVIQLEVNLVDL